MPEHQEIEWKESWRDEYLKWLCGYANAHGEMPADLRTAESVFAKHSSKPFNPKLAHIFFVSGMIEAWGRGFDKIKAACDALFKTPMPEYNISDNGIMVRCNANDLYLQLMNENRLGIDESILRRLETIYETIRLTNIGNGSGIK